MTGDLTNHNAIELLKISLKIRIIQSCFLSVLDYGDVVCMHENLSLLKKLDCIYHASIQFLMNASSLLTVLCTNWLVGVPKEKNAYAAVYCQGIIRQTANLYL